MPKTLDSVIKAALEKKIGEQVWKILKDHIDEEIYKHPIRSNDDDHRSRYRQRRSGGLLNEADKYIKVLHEPGSNQYTLRVTTTAPPSPSTLGWAWVPSIGGFLQMLEIGDLGYVSKGRKKTRTLFPRPAISTAQDEVNRNKKKYEAEIYAAINKAMSR